MSDKFNPLIVIPSPRDIDIVKQSINDILIQGNNSLQKKCDVLWVKYYEALEAYNIGAKYFLEHKEDYSHLVMIPDDLVLNVDAWDKLVCQLQEIDFDVLSGVCNMSLYTEHEKNQANVTFKQFPDPSIYTTEQIMGMFPTFDELGSSDMPQKVLFSGLPVTFIHRRIMEKLQRFAQNTDHNCCLDLMFNKWLKENGIDPYIISSARFLHLKQDPDNKQSRMFFVNLRPAHTKLVSDNKEQIITFDDEHDD